MSKPRRARAGRPRKDRARHPNGHLVYRPESPEPEFLLDQRFAALTGTEPRLAAFDRHHSVLADDQEADIAAERRTIVHELREFGRDARAGSPLGLMAIFGLISAEEFEAGEKYEATHQYCWGAMPGRPNPAPRSHLAGMIADGSDNPWLRDLPDTDRGAVLATCHKVMRQCEAILRMCREFNSFNEIVLYHRAPHFLARVGAHGGEFIAAARKADAAPPWMPPADRYELDGIRECLTAMRRVFRV